MAIETMRLSNAGPFAVTIDGERVQFDPRLDGPIALGSRISAEQPGQSVRGVPNGGAIGFKLGGGRLASESDVWAWLGRGWKGQTFRVYRGRQGDRYEDLELVYTGRVEDLSHDTLTASVKTATGGVDLDNPLVEDLYGDDAPEPLRGRPKPRLDGQGLSLAPVLYEEPTQTYHVSTASGAPPLAAITDVRVGGVSWTEIPNVFPGITAPVGAQWMADLAAGTFRLGSATAGGEVRCDAKAVGWESLTTAALVRAIVTEAGSTVNEIAMTALDADAPYLIGWYTTTEPITRPDALDQILAGLGGYWGVGADTAVVAGVIAAPAATATLSLSGVGIDSLQLAGLVPPVWRLRVEHSRNWQPQQSFFSGVSDADQQRWREAGLVAPALEGESIKTAEPRAVDAPLIRSLVQNEADATAIATRLFAAYSVARRIYNVGVWVDAPELYDTVSVDYRMISEQRFRVLSTVRSYGGGPNTLQLWG